jgi:outer membrane lipoprotein SlyB
MDTTVTGIFPDPQLARLAVAHLHDAGFASNQVRIVDHGARDRHQFIRERTADTKRAVLFGIGFGTLVGALTGTLLSGLFDTGLAIAIGALVGALGGAVLGTVVGRSTTTQMGDELENQVDAGNVLVSVTTDAAHGQQALDVLARDGGVNMVSTSATFRAGVLPVAHPGEPQEEIAPKQS